MKLHVMMSCQRIAGRCIEYQIVLPLVCYVHAQRLAPASWLVIRAHHVSIYHGPLLTMLVKSADQLILLLVCLCLPVAMVLSLCDVIRLYNIVLLIKRLTLPCVFVPVVRKKPTVSSLYSKQRWHY